jgi:2-succinyl-6-hydroxy-2,4-cyclohexadiene-1-carboxylate synthase
MRVERQDGGMSKAVVLLHGFAGTAHHWDRVTALLDRESYSPFALDLGPDALRQVADVAPERFILCGYSMGGRVALHAAVAAPERVERLVLVSASAGIDDQPARLAADEALAQRIERETIEQFITHWRANAIFAADPDWVHDAVAADTRRLEPARLAATLRALSPGRMAPLWDRLSKLTVPTTVIAGERDARYCEIARRMAGALPDARLLIVPGAGHRVAIEAPEAVAAVIAATGPPAAGSRGETATRSSATDRD